MSPAKLTQYQNDEINCPNMMMATRLATLLATNNLCGDFQTASGYLCNFVASNKNEGITRNISVLESEDKRATGRSPSCGNSDDQGVTGAFVEVKFAVIRKESTTHSYTTEEWGQLTMQKRNLCTSFDHHYCHN